MAAAAGRRPNVLVCGTPGTGKTTTCARLAAVTGLTHVDVGKLVREKDLHSGWDEEFQAHLIDEDKVVDELEPAVGGAGGCIVDYHGCDFFPERWFDLVVVLRTDNGVLGYPEKKVTENIECEIMQVVTEEAHESAEIIMVADSNTEEDMARNVAAVAARLEQQREAAAAAAAEAAAGDGGRKKVRK